MRFVNPLSGDPKKRTELKLEKSDRAFYVRMMTWGYHLNRQTVDGWGEWLSSVGFLVLTVERRMGLSFLGRVK
jgi:hypothetical protein